MIKYFLKSIACPIIAVILAFSIVGLVLSTLFVGSFSNESYVEKRMYDNRAKIIEDINKEVKPLAKATQLGEEAYVNAVNDDNFSIVSHTVARNLKYCYKTDFSDNTDLYSIYYNSISKAASSSGKRLKSSVISEYASLAVYTASRVINAEDTSTVPLFRSIRGKTFVYYVVTTVILTVAAFVAIDLINKGRHRKFSYMGMGIITAGYISLFGTFFVNKMNYVGKNVFLEYSPYNEAVQNSVNDLLKLLYIFGVLLLVIGVVMLVVNYNYFRKKNIKAEEEKEFNKRVITDFLEYDEPTVSHRLSDGEGFEKEITKIDFDE